MAWYSGDAFERQTLYDRWSGTYAWTYWPAVFCTLRARRRRSGSACAGAIGCGVLADRGASW